MNRMIKLFQMKADTEFGKYIKNRNECIARETIDTPAWTAAVVRGADLKARSETWQRAAELLRKEEINNVK